MVTRKIWAPVGYLTAILGVAAVSTALFLPSIVDRKLREGIEDAVILSPDARAQGTDMWKAWQNNCEKPGTPLDFQVWFFNITNPEAMVAGTSKAKLEEIGPYSFTECIRRFNTSFQRDIHEEEVLQYHEWKSFRFNRDKTPTHLSEDDRMTTVNLAFKALEGTFYHIPFGQEVLSEVLYPDSEGWTDRTRLLQTRSVKEWLWGYPDPVLGKLNQTFPGALKNVSNEADAVASGWNQLYTGAGNVGLARQLRMRSGQVDVLTPPSLINTSETSETWGGREANRIVGTDGSQFRPGLVGTRGGNSVTAYVADLYRTVSLSHLEPDSFQEKGISLRKYRLSESVFQTLEDNPFNAQYYQRRKGLFNLTRARSGTPIFVSLPHFFKADDEHRAKLEGITPPDPESHEVYLGIEATTGAVMVAKKRMQINCLIQPLDISSSNGTQKWFQNIGQETYFPKEGAVISSDRASDFQSTVYMAQDLSYYVFWVGGCAGLGLLVMSWAILEKRFRLSRAAKGNTPSLSDGYDDELVNIDKISNHKEHLLQ